MFTRVNEEQATRLLARQHLGRLGCITDTGPYIIPISYYLEQGYIYSHSLPGMKISALRNDPRACLQVDEIDSEVRWQSALVFGTFEEVVKPGERSEVLNKLLKLFPMLTPVESAVADDGGPPPIIVFRIRIERITGVAEE